MFDRSDVQVLQRESLYSGFFKMIRLTLSHPLFRGGRSVDFQREVFLRGTAVAVLPWDPRTDEVVLVEQFRVGALVPVRKIPGYWKWWRGFKTNRVRIWNRSCAGSYTKKRGWKHRH